MLPLLGAAIGGVGTVASGLIGAQAANRADDTNWQINLLNYYQRERERQDAIAEAQANKRDQKLGYTDADGSRTQFIEGRGWVTDLSKEAEQVKDAQRNEQMAVLLRDLPMRRRAMERNEQRSLSDEASADALRRDMKSAYRPTDEALEGILYGAATTGLARGYDDATATATREAARTDSSNIDRILSGINKDRAESYGRAALEAKLKARGSGDAEFNKNREGLANLYNMFATRASVAPDVSYKPEAVGNSNDAFAAQGGKQLLASGKTLSDAFGAKGGTMDYVQPNYGMANAVGGGASALAGMFRGMAAQKFGQEDEGGGYLAGYNKRLIG